MMSTSRSKLPDCITLFDCGSLRQTFNKYKRSIPRKVEVLTWLLGGHLFSDCPSSQSSLAHCLATRTWRARPSAFRRLMMGARWMLVSLLALLHKLLLLSVPPIDIIILGGASLYPGSTSLLLPPRTPLRSAQRLLGWRSMHLTVFAWLFLWCLEFSDGLSWSSNWSSRLRRHRSQSFNQVSQIAGLFALRRRLRGSLRMSCRIMRKLGRMPCQMVCG